MAIESLTRKYQSRQRRRLSQRGQSLEDFARAYALLLILKQLSDRLRGLQRRLPG